MARTCRSCLWISGDDAEACERCGQPFDAARGAGAGQSWGTARRAARTAAAVIALGVLATVIVNRLGFGFPQLWQNVTAGLAAGYVWLLGPNEIYKPYLLSVVIVTILVWVVLWLLAKL